MANGTALVGRLASLPAAMAGIDRAACEFCGKPPERGSGLDEFCCANADRYAFLIESGHNREIALNIMGVVVAAAAEMLDIDIEAEQKQACENCGREFVASVLSDSVSGADPFVLVLCGDCLDAP